MCADSARLCLAGLRFLGKPTLVPAQPHPRFLGGANQSSSARMTAHGVKGYVHPPQALLLLADHDTAFSLMT